MSLHRYTKVTLTITALILSGVYLLGSQALAANDISHSYKTKDDVTSGDIVSLIPGTGSAQLANGNNDKQLLGIVVDGSDSLLDINPTSGSIQVAIGGEIPVLVSSLNGPIKAGDQVTVSPLNGIGMEAAADFSVVGTAQTNFNPNSPDTITRNITNKQGKITPVRIGYISLDINLDASNSKDTATPISGLQKAIQDVTGRVIPTPRIILSMGITVVALLGIATLMYASIYGSILSIGRNPLAKFTILRSLYYILALAVLIAVIAGIIDFLLLS